MVNYPASKDEFREVEGYVSGPVEDKHKLKAGDQNNWKEWIEAFQDTMGYGIKMGYDTVKDFFDWVVTQLGLKLPKSGGIMTGDLSMNGCKVNTNQIEPYSGATVEIAKAVSAALVGIGSGAAPSWNNSIAIGSSSASHIHSVAVGSYAVCGATEASAFGYKAKANNGRSVSIGRACQASADYAMIIGMSDSGTGPVNSVGETLVISYRYDDTTETKIIISKGKIEFYENSNLIAVIDSNGIESKADVIATGFKTGGNSGVSGSFTSQDGKTVTVTNGIITSIV